MTEHIRSFLRGVGTLLELAPSTNYRRFIPQESPAERVGSVWIKVGKGLADTTERVVQRERKNSTLSR